MADEVYRCPSCKRVFLEKKILKAHSSQVHDEPIIHREVEPELLAVGDEDAPEPVRGLR